MREKSLPNIVEQQFRPIDRKALFAAPRSTHKPRILMLYGSCGERSYSRLVTEEAARVLHRLGANVRIYDSFGLPLPNPASVDRPKVRELRSLHLWSEAHVWCSPDRHGAMTRIMNAQINWLSLMQDSVHASHGRTLAMLQVSGGPQSFKTVSQLRLPGRWIRIVTFPAHATIARAVAEFDEAGRMRPSPYYNRIVDTMEELMKFTLLLRDRSAYLTDRYSARVENAEEIAKPLS